MKTRRQLKARFDQILRLAKNSTLFSDEMKNDFVNDAITYVATLHKWPQREMCAKYISGTEAGYGYYDYPNTPVQFAAGSIRELIIDGITYANKDYYDLIKYVNGEIKLPANLEKHTHWYANFGSWFLIFPVIDLDGLEIHATGVVQPSPLLDDDSETIWSDDMEQLNEAVLEYMLYIATHDTNHLTLCINMADQVWGKFVGEKQKNVPINRPFLKVPDMMRL